MEINITAIVAGSDEDVCVSFELVEGENRSRSRFWLPLSVFARLSLTVGTSSQNVYDTVELESKIFYAYKKALYLLSFGMQSRKTLQKKLVMRGCEAEIVCIAIDRLVESRLLIEEDSAVREAEKCAEKLWGETRIRAHLVSKGYGEAEIKKAFFGLEDNGVDFSFNCSKLIKKKYLPLPKDKKEMQKIIAALLRYGYSMSQIKSALLEQ